MWGGGVGVNAGGEFERKFFRGTMGLIRADLWVNMRAVVAFDKDRRVVRTNSFIGK
jgi:hypothetical protein